MATPRSFCKGTLVYIVVGTPIFGLYTRRFLVTEVLPIAPHIVWSWNALSKVASEVGGEMESDCETVLLFLSNGEKLAVNV